MEDEEMLRENLFRALLEWEERKLANKDSQDVKFHTITERMAEIIQQQEKSNAVYSVIELSKYLGVSKDSIYSMVREKQIPHFRIRRRILFHRDAIDSWIRSAETL